MTERDRRIAANQTVFREVNERLEDLNRTFGAITEEMELVCECGRTGCDARLSLTVVEYEEVRADPTLFVVAPGHAVEDVETFVGRREGYELVKKRPGDPEEIAEATDPRA